MTTKIVKYSDFESQMREYVLAAIDLVVRNTMDTDKVNGWVDGDLRSLFPCINQHATTIANRINDPDSTVINSAFIQIDMEH